MDEAESLKEYVKSMLDSYSNTLTKVMFGDFNVRAVSEKDDEFAPFATYLNTLIASLQRKDNEVKERTKELQKHQKYLEEKIAERTKELEESKKQLDERVERLEKNKIAMLNMMEDLQGTITSLEKADAEITFLKEYNENILESNPNPIMVINENQIEYVNKSFISIFGETKNEYITKYLKDVIPSEIFPVFENLSQNSDRKKELKVKGKDFDVHSFKIKKEETEEEKRMGIILQDITERKKMENELKEKIEELERYKRATVGRELRMIELKTKMDELCKKLGEKPR
ncbi:MAG: PAS domain-containing protein [Methanobacteriota archaeon]